MPKPELAPRIIADELPPVTYSRSSFDMPMRRDVLQADIPISTTRTIETNIDPRFPPKKQVQVVRGTLYHGTGSTDEKVIHGIPSFLQKKAKKTTTHSKHKSQSKHKAHSHAHAKAHSHSHAKSHAKAHSHSHAKSHAKAKVETQAKMDPLAIKAEAVGLASQAGATASNLLNIITNDPAPVSHMVLDAEVTNRREHPSIKLHEHNHHLLARNAAIRHTPQGVRAAHTIRRLG